MAASKVTYADKSNVNASVDPTKEVRAEDLNEIKSVMEANADLIDLNTAHREATGNPHGITTADIIGLENVDNTSDVDKPVSTATQTALNLKSNIANPTFITAVTSPIFDTGVAAAGVTLSGSTLSADGTDANISITITPKGTGSVVISKADINGGTVDGTDVTVGAGNTLNVSAGTLTLASGQVKASSLQAVATDLGAADVTIDLSNSNVGVYETHLTTNGVITSPIFDTGVATAGVTLSGTTLSADGTDLNIPITITPKGTGSVVISKADINGGTIDGSTIGASSATTGVFTSVTGTSVITPAVLTADNAASQVINIPVTGTDATSHTLSLQVDGNSGLTIAATGDGAGGVGINTIVLGAADSSLTVNSAGWAITSTGTATLTQVDTNVAEAGMVLQATSLSADGTDENISITIAPKGTGSVVLPKVDINAGTIDGVTIDGATIATSDITVGTGKVLTLTDGTVLLPSGTPVNAGASFSVLTSTGVAPTDGKTVVIDTKIYTFKDALTPLEGEVLINTTAEACLVNLKAAINHTGTPDTDYSCAAVHHSVTATDIDATTLKIEAKIKGVAGDALATTSDEATLSWTGSNLGGGVNATIGVANTWFTDSSYLYKCIATNTVADSNWRRISLGMVY